MANLLRQADRREHVAESGEAQADIEEYANSLREIIKAIRRKLTH
jgi:hypothetical protein